MKVAIHNSARVWGGNEKWMSIVAAGLRARGHDVVVSCRAGGEVARRCAEAGVRTSPARPGAYLDLPRAVRFAAWLARERPDALLLTSWTETLWGAWAGRWAGVPRVLVRLGLPRVPDRWRYALPFRRWVDGMIVNAPEIRDRWLAAAPWFPAERVHTVLNGVAPRPVDRAAARERLCAETGAPAGAVLVGAAGHVSPRKGFDLLLEALAREELSGAWAVVAGAGPALGGLKERAAGLGVADRVAWLGHREDVPRVLAGCDLFALPSRSEGMANVMLEAMSVGTPVVAAGVGGVHDAIGANGRPPAGWTVPPGDSAALARALAEAASLLARDPAAVRARVDEAGWRVENRFGVERMVDHAASVLLGPAAFDPRGAGAGAPPLVRPVPARTFSVRPGV